MRHAVRLFCAATALMLSGAIAFSQQGAPMFGGFLANSADPISIDADELQWSQQSGRDVLEYTGGVIASRGDMRISAARLAVFLPNELGADRTFDRIEASGNVTMRAGDQNVSADVAIMDMVGQTVTMSGSVELNDGTNEMGGDRLTIDLTTGNWQLSGTDRVRTIINPDNDQ